MYEKSCLHQVAEQPKPSGKPNASELPNANDWNKNIVRVIEAMTAAHIARENALKGYYKLLDASHQAVTN
jgi:hypothetical protein